jgi:hypothetical protein
MIVAAATQWTCFWLNGISANARYWHKADIAAALNDVRCRR